MMDIHHDRRQCSLNVSIRREGTTRDKEMAKNNNDLRVIRTKASIRQAFSEMVMEMDYGDITIKELTERAMINRNTFYLHYDSIEALLKELMDEVAARFVQEEVSYSSMKDIKAMIRLS